ncbi:hypothetical protein [Nitrosophilus alvini]|uniref:hypothetical protein n=1 Tax=Nitrosophilus alvini TaxID=2714855 RepID=UPI00190BE3C2|nr:hypothetical protein [Nitrosophilus alvini]
MGGDRIENIKKIIDEVFICLENGEFEKLEELAIKLQTIDLSVLTEEEKKDIFSSVNSIISLVSEKKAEVANHIEQTQKLKKFKF